MTMIRIALLGLAAVLSMGAGKANWTATVTVAENGTHVLGNPNAKVKLTEFVSYTCPHCGHFEKEADAPMRLAYVMPGKVSVKVQNVVRDPIDLTVAMLTNCGDPDGFFKRHHIFLYEQDKWIAKASDITQAQRKRWADGPIPKRLEAIADDFDFYDIMAHRGYSRADVDQCLADMTVLAHLSAQAEDATNAGVTGTPSFLLNGKLLDEAHSWDALQPKIAALLN